MKKVSSLVEQKAFSDDLDTINYLSWLTRIIHDAA
jgi:hypothetical protein